MNGKLRLSNLLSLRLRLTVLFFFIILLFQPNKNYSFQFDGAKDYADTNFTILGKVQSGYCNAVELIGGHYIAVGSGRGLRILDLNATPKAKMVSQIYTGGCVEDLAAEGDYLYILLNGVEGFFVNEQYPTGVVIVDVSNPGQPIKKSFVDFSNLAIARAIAVKNGYVYASYYPYFLGNKGRHLQNEVKGHYDCGLVQIDATNPDNPQIVRNIGPICSDNMVINGNYLFVGGSHLIIYDITNNSISQVSSIPRWTWYVSVNDSLLFSLDLANSVKIYSISDIANPEELSEFYVSNTSYDYKFWAAASSGEYLYLTGRAKSISGHAGGVTIQKINVSNPAQPQISAGFILLNRLGYGTGLNIRLSNGNAYVAGDFAMEVFSVDDYSINFSEQYPTYYFNGGIELVDNVAYFFYQAVRDQTGIIAFDITNPKTIIELGSCDVSTNYQVELSSYRVSNGYAYFGLYDPNSPQEESGVKILDLGSMNSDEPDISFIKVKDFNALDVYQNTLYIASNDTLYVYNVDNPQNPVYVSQLYISSWDYGYLKALTAQGDYLYISTSNGLLISSILSPQTPSILGFYYSQNGSVFNKPTINDNFAYLPGKSSLDIVNISNPSAPYLVKSFSRFGDVKNVSIAEGYVYVLCEHGVIANQWAEDTLITKAVFSCEAFKSGNIVTRGSVSYVASDYDGLVILKNDNLSDASDENILPNAIELYQNYPNPFNPTTNITYVIANPDEIGVKQSTEKSAYADNSTDCHVNSNKLEFTRNDRVVQVSLKIYDILGREVATLVKKKQSPGKYSVQFDAGGLPSGVYFYTLRAGDFVQTRKMVLLK